MLFTGGGGEAAALEANFIESLLETRKLQRHAATILAELVGATNAPATSASAASEKLLARLSEAHADSKALLGMLDVQRTTFTALQQARKVVSLHSPCCCQHLIQSDRKAFNFCLCFCGSVP